MNIADLFLQELEKDTAVGPTIRKLGTMLAQKHKEALETTAELARRQCEMFRKFESEGLRLTRNNSIRVKR